MWGNEKFNQKALFSDESGNYRKPAEPDRGERVEIKFRTARNDVDLVYLICGNQKTAMEKTYSKDMFDYYVCALGPLEGPVHYFFEIIVGNQRCFYNKLGVTGRSAGSVRIPDSAGFSHAGLGEGRSYVPDLHRPVPERRAVK